MFVDQERLTFRHSESKLLVKTASKLYQKQFSYRFYRLQKLDEKLTIEIWASKQQKRLTCEHRLTQICSTSFFIETELQQINKSNQKLHLINFGAFFSRYRKEHVFIFEVMQIGYTSVLTDFFFRAVSRICSISVLTHFFFNLCSGVNYIANQTKIEKTAR